MEGLHLQVPPASLDWEPALESPAFKVLMGRLNKCPKVTMEGGFPWTLFIYPKHLTLEMLQTIRVRRTRKQLFTYVFDCERIYLCFLHQENEPVCHWTDRGSAPASLMCWLGIAICLHVWGTCKWNSSIASTLSFQEGWAGVCKSCVLALS